MNQQIACAIHTWRSNEISKIALEGKINEKRLSGYPSQRWVNRVHNNLTKSTHYTGIFQKIEDTKTVDTNRVEWRSTDEAQ